MKAIVVSAALLPLLVSLSACPASARHGCTILHDFTCAKGSQPHGGLILDGGRLYGTTEAGGCAGFGMAFGIPRDGTGFSILYWFVGIPPDGYSPSGGFVSHAGRLYGMTEEGGRWGFGTLFSMRHDGTGFARLFDFRGSDGAHPAGIPVLRDGRLYGVTAQGGDHDEGVLFGIAPDGTKSALLHHFGSPGDGRTPGPGLLAHDGRLYGTTEGGGVFDLGTVYSTRTDGTGYSVLHDFSGGAPAGSAGPLVSDGSRLYGVTSYGGAAGLGTAFSLAVGGGGFTILHEFAGPPDDGAGPSGGLALDGRTLYGTTVRGGRHGGTGGGTLFSLRTDGDGFTVLHHFAGAGVTPADGSRPRGGLLLGDGVLYGATGSGGAFDYGTVYAHRPAPLRLTLNKTAFAAGDRLTADVAVQPIPQAFDAWAVITREGASYSMVPGRPGEARSGLQPFVRGVNGLAGVYTSRLLDLAVPSGAAGTYRVIAGLVPAGVPPTGVESAIDGYADQCTVTAR